MRILTTSRFERRLKVFLKDHPDLSKTIKERMGNISDDPFATSLKTHKLSGPLKDCFASSITYSYRIIYIISEDSVCFLDIGSHNDVY